MKSKDSNSKVKEYKSKLLISCIKLLVPNFDKTFYLNIIVNEDKTFNTKKFDFKKSSSLDINLVFELESVNSIDNIRFQIYEKTSIFSNSLFKGEVKRNSLMKDENNNLLCFLSNNNGENCAVVYYTYEVNSDLIQTFDLNLKKIEENRVNKNENKSVLSNLMDLASGENAENFAKFVHNMEYLKTIQNSIVNLINWENPWKTISFLLIITFSFSYWKLLFILFPLILIYFHLCNRDSMDKFSHKKTRHDNLANMNLITKTIEMTNKAIEYYENFLEAIQYSDTKIYEMIYVNLIKLCFLNFFILYFPLIRVKTMILYSLLAFIMWKNPTFKPFTIFLINFVNKKFINKLMTFHFVKHYFSIVSNHSISIIPFAGLIRQVYEIKKDIDDRCLVNSSSTQASNKIKEVIESLNEKTVVVLTGYLSKEELIKYEIYENERWWMFVGWAKNLIMNERPLWSDPSGRTFLDKNSVFLPNNQDYHWTGDWKVELTENCDPQGWEYSSDFNSNFGAKSGGKYVRRRKWIRYAKKTNNSK